MENTHITWSIERGGKCPTCGGKTVLISAPPHWEIDTETGYDGDDVAVREEISGHYCKPCQRLVSLSLNTSV